jgi:hypothetical protein
VPSLAGSALLRKPSLTQNTDSCVLANLSVFLLREHLLYHLSIPAYCYAGALHQVPTLIGCWLLKNFNSICVDR